MPVVGSFVFPHGAITLDPDTRNFDGVPAATPTSKEECIKLHNAMTENAESLVNLKPDLIILSTPHGLKLANDFLFVGNSKMKGDAQWDGEWSDFRAEFDIEDKCSASLMSYLKERANAVELLSIGKPDDPLPLRWGEVIPWWYINNAAERKSFQLPPVILVGLPKRIREPEKMIPELLKLGEDIFEWLESDEIVSSKKVAVVISSDLSHYHSTDPSSPYPYSSLASVFDGYIGEWAAIDFDLVNKSESYDKLVSKGGSVANQVGTCGYTGLVILHGILSKSCESGGTHRAKLLYYSAPTYYGMMVNNFILD